VIKKKEARPKPKTKAENKKGFKMMTDLVY
jgi:hypothetical protein